MAKTPAKPTLASVVIKLIAKIGRLEKRIKELEKKMEVVYDIEDRPMNNDQINKPNETHP